MIGAVALLLVVALGIFLLYPAMQSGQVDVDTGQALTYADKLAAFVATPDGAMIVVVVVMTTFAMAMWKRPAVKYGLIGASILALGWFVYNQVS